MFFYGGLPKAIRAGAIQKVSYDIKTATVIIRSVFEAEDILLHNKSCL